MSTPTLPAYAPDYDLSRYWMREVFLRGCDKVNSLVADLGGWDALPPTLTVGGPAWEEVEDAISGAAYAGRWWETIARGDEYLRRIDAFCAAWRVQMEKKAMRAGRR